MRWLPWALAGYVLTRALLGIVLNPPLNGPDEGGHVEYIQSWIASGGHAVTGVEGRQPPLYYVIATVPWQLAASWEPAARLAAVRLLSALAALAVALVTWHAARWRWPQDPALAVAAVAVASLAPGTLYLASSAANDLLAAALASLCGYAAVRVAGGSEIEGQGSEGRDQGPLVPQGDGNGEELAVGVVWWMVWAVAGTLAVATKLTAVPVVAGTAAGLLWNYRLVVRRVLRFRLVQVTLVAGVIAMLAGYVMLLQRHPSTSALASLAHFWPSMLLHTPVAYVSGGLAESFRTFWYAYDYAVPWPRPVELVAAAGAVLLLLFAVAGLAIDWRRVPVVLALATLAQVCSVAGRYGFGDVLDIAMGGAGQAKAFFPALLPLSLLMVMGLAGVARRAGIRDSRWPALAVVFYVLAADVVSLALTVWQHYRWWQVAG